MRVGLSILQLTGSGATGPYGLGAVDEIELLLGCSMLHEHAGKVP